MPRHVPPPDDKPPARGWSARIAWLALAGGAVLVLARMSVATVVRVHGDGMAPTLVDADYVLVTRDAWRASRGDIVLYDPAHASTPSTREHVPLPRTGVPRKQGPLDARKPPERALRNARVDAAVVDREQLDDNWKQVQRKQDGIARREHVPLRLGRVLAVPGDTVTFHVPNAALGLAINGTPLSSKAGETIRIRLDNDHDFHPLAYETTDARRYPVLVDANAPPPAWRALELPAPELGPVQTEALGYLVVADNREQTACCDSRALGWLPAEAIRGRIMLRFAGDPEATPDLAPETRGVLWKP